MKLFISKLHYKKNLSITEKIMVFMLRIAGIPYEAASEARNFLYNKKILRSYGSKSFVISIGNITTGGVGKTPFTSEVAKYYLSLNKKVAIISRGYGGKLCNKEPHVISEGGGALYSAELAGDEPVWLSNNTKGACVITCSSRVKAEKYLQEHYSPDIIILDDGFQHRKLKRDLDIVLIDSQNKFGNKLTFPAGPLRENLQNIRRADKIVVVNKNYENQNALKYCDKLKKKYKKAIYLCKIVPDYVYNINTGSQLTKDTAVMAFSAIGQPEGFYEFLKRDYRLTAVLEFEDHHRYEADDISRIIHYAQDENIDKIVTTEKDAVKIKELIQDMELPVQFYALKLKAYMDIKEVCGI